MILRPKHHSPETRMRNFGRALRAVLGQPVACNDPLVVLALGAISDAMTRDTAPEARAETGEVTSMTRTEFYGALQKSVDDFNRHWEAQQKERGRKEYPEAMSDEEWFEQYLAFRTIEEPELLHG